jgi:acetoacetate decarboxylase
MHEKEVLERAFAMPLTNPAYSLGPCRFVTRIPDHHISHRSREAAGGSAGAAQVDEREALVKYEFIRMPARPTSTDFRLWPKADVH